MLKPSYHTIKNFKFQSGTLLEEINLEYTTLGRAKRDSEGNIQNGLLFLHGSSGDYTSFERFIHLTEVGQVFDRDKFFIISTTALGSPGSSAPSTSPLKGDFPGYTIKDMVNAQHRLLKEHLHINHLRGVIGTSMGGFQALEWAVSYSDFIDFIIPIVTGSAVLGRNLAIFKVMNSIIQDHPDYNSGWYLKNPEEAVKNAHELLFLFAFSPLYYHKEFSPNEMLLQALKDQGKRGKTKDANNEVWRNNAAMSFDLQKELSKIKAKTLIIGIEGDQFFPPEIDAIPLSKSIKNSELFIYPSIMGHLGINEVEKMQKTLEDFISKI